MKDKGIAPMLGDFGRYQIGLLVYLCTVSVLGCLTTLSNVFMGATSDHWCRVLPEEDCSAWPELQNNCTQMKKSMLIPPSTDVHSKYPYSNCKQYEQPDGYDFDPYDRPAAITDNLTDNVVSCQDGYEYDTSQYKTTVISEFSLVCEDGSLAAVAQSLYFVGFLVGSFVFGSMSDWIGRKKTVIISLLVWMAAFLATSFSVNIYMYAACRLLSGMGNIGCYISLFVLLLEVVGKSWRAPVTMIAGVAFAVGYFVLSVCAMYVKDWRTLGLICSAPMVILFIPLPFIQESIRWLVSKGRVEEAEACIRRVAKYNGKTLPDVLFDKDDLEEQRESHSSTIPPSFIDLYRTPNMAIKTINMQYNWLVNSLVYYGLSQSTGDLGVNIYWAFFVSGAVEIPALIYATFGVEWFGRRLNTAVLELIGGGACLTTIFIPVGIWRTAVSMIGKFCISATFSIVYLYTTELFPTPVRAVGLGMCSLASRVGGILSPVILLLGNSSAHLPLIVFGLSAVLAGILALFLPETRGHKLPQTLKEGEEFGKCRCMMGSEDNQSDVELAVRV